MSHLRVERRLGAEQNRVQLLHGRAQRHLRLHTAMKEVATRDEKGFGWEVPLTGPLRDARRFPSTRWCPVPGTTRTTPGFEICPSFNCQFLSPCQTSELRFATFCIAVVGRSDRQRADRCVRVRVGVSGVATSRVLGTRRWRLSNPILRFVVSSGAGESSRAAPPHRPREDRLAHPADTSRPNLAHALGLFSRWRLCQTRQHARHVIDHASGAHTGIQR